MNTITNVTVKHLLNLEDENIIITNIGIKGHEKIVMIETKPVPHFCPSCSFKMHSRGIKKRTIRHPILQDGYHLVFTLKQRRWRCTNPDCMYDIEEQFNFVNKKCRTSNATEWLVVDAYKDLNRSTVSIANQFNISDTMAHNIFTKYVDMPRLPLTEAISVDEVFLEMDDDCKYAMLIQDFRTGEPIDLLPSRRNKYTEAYFNNIPMEERLKVKYLISDMYAPYIAMVDKFFPNAVSVVDSFHVIQWINNQLEQYLRALLSKYRKRDRELEQKKSVKRGKPVRLPKSTEVYLLEHYKWVLLRSVDNIEYRTDLVMDKHFHRYMNTYDYEYEFFKIDSNLEEFRKLKELYIDFNKRNEGNPIKANEEIDIIIDTYEGCGHKIFEDFAELLKSKRQPIINSFIMVEKVCGNGTYMTRLSNGPIESINRKIKDLKRNGRGWRSFEHFRNRFLYANRENPVFNGSDGIKTLIYYK